jgi:ribonuclease HI
MEFKIFCDGACKGNGKKGAIAGYAAIVFEGRRPIEEIKARVPKAETQTNQRAELRALMLAMRLATGKYAANRPGIFSDSMYAIKIAREWGPKWREAGWSRPGGKDLSNLDLVIPLVELAMAHPEVVITHVRAHTVSQDDLSHCNSLVDRAAVAALDLPDV